MALEPIQQQRRDAHAKAMERLVVVVQELSYARSLAAIQEIVRRAARELTQADGAAFVLRDGEFCHYADEDAIGPLWKGLRFPMQSCISGWAMLNRRAVVIEDVYLDPRIPHDVYRRTFVKSLAMVPIRGGAPLGAIGIYWAQRHRADDEAVRLLQALADATALAMENVEMRTQLERRVLERTAEAVAAREIAERADALKTRLLSAANHDLRQPLQSVKTYLALLAPDLASPEKRELCARAQRSIEAMDELLDTLLDLQRIQGGQLRAALRDFALAELLERIVVENRPRAEAKGLRLDLRMAPCVAHSDPALLRRVFENLVGNAIRYTAAGHVLIEAEATAQAVRVAVSDTGIGIPDEALERIFEAYYQAEHPAHVRSGGLGLGLSIVQHLAGVLGLRVEVRSTPGIGSTFAVELPLGAPLVAAPRLSVLAAGAALRRAPRAEGPLVLLVEDDAAIADATRLLMRSAGFGVCVVSGFAAALQQLDEGLQPAVVVTDFRLPGSNGIEVIGRVREKLGRELPAVLFTGDMSGQAARMATQAGCALLHKPSDAERLLTVIEALTSAPLPAEPPASPAPSLAI
ncbi:hybrid sensor histidine kinase/response regulator [Solimonas flava]|uniref:hybrid sensor histidine kinase/response regulator n=1 Tax=Solimonas flava TaxID=415849 RepID=UPI0004082946|nr:hybrid sensor histidine kinase/response regulator [Solimonas flava]